MVELKELSGITFPRDLNLDRKAGKYCFGSGPDRVGVLESGKSIDMEGLKLLFHPYVAVRPARVEEMFDAEVLGHLLQLLKSRGAVPAAAPSPPLPVEAARPPPPPPSVKVAGLREEMREQVFERISTAQGKNDLIEGKLDTEIQGLVDALCEELSPRQIIASRAPGAGKADVDVFMDQTLASQAFGSQLQLGKADLFLLAKSAVFQSLNESDRKNIRVIKQALILGKSSPNYQKRLTHYFAQIANFLRGRRVAAELVNLVHDSKFIYLDAPARGIPEPALALAIADAFVTLQEAGKLTLEIMRILTQRLKRTLGPSAQTGQRAVETLLRDSCYNQYRRALDSRYSGGDHCDFHALTPLEYSLLIFDVAGHEEQASVLRDILASALERVPEPGDPGRTLAALNRFVLQHPFPEDVFVSMVYGVVDLAQNRFTYANAGHHPPYLVRRNRLHRLEEAIGLALNLEDTSYQNGVLRLETGDCLVLYTDGLTEAVNEKVAAGRKELFGLGRLENAITARKVGDLRAKRAVEAILAAVQDQGFKVQDDITVQVYRHI